MINELNQQIIVSRDIKTVFSDQYQSFYLHVFVTVGHLSLQVDDLIHQVNAGDGIILIERKPVTIVECSDDITLVGLMLSLDYLRQHPLKITFNVRGLSFYYKNPVMRMNDEQMQMCLHGLEQIEYRLHLTGHLYQLETLYRTIDIFTYDIFSIYTLCNNEQSTKGGQEAVVAQKFIDAVKEHVRTERTVAFYAGKLFVTPKYLSRVCVQATGHNASYWISQFALSLMLDDITKSNRSLTDISDSFHFQSLSHFTRFIKERTGSTPSEFRMKK